jgi:hypothetical protein
MLTDYRNEYVTRTDASLDCFNEVDTWVEVIDIDKNLIRNEMPVQTVV